MERFALAQEPMLCSGHAACPGCIDALAARHILATMGPDTMAIIPPSCMAIIAGPQPMSSLKIPVYQPTLESSAAAASGLRRALDALGKRDTQVLVLAGDGGTYDIGFQCLSSAAERNEDFLYVCLDNEGYMNTGAQKSSSTPHFARTGSTPAGKTTRKKNLVEIMAAHGIPYAATASASHLPDLVRKVEKAKSIRGTRFLSRADPLPRRLGAARRRGPDRRALRGRVRRLPALRDRGRHALDAQRGDEAATGRGLPRAAAAATAGCPRSDVATLQARGRRRVGDARPSRGGERRGPGLVGGQRHRRRRRPRRRRLLANAGAST